MLNLETDPETLAEYERIMGLNEDVLRFMNITIDEVLEDPSIMMQAAKSSVEDVVTAVTVHHLDVMLKTTTKPQITHQMQLRNRHLQMTLRSEA